MYEVTIVLTVLLVGTIIGLALKPNPDESRPLSHEEIRGHAADTGHHH